MPSRWPIPRLRLPTRNSVADRASGSGPAGNGTAGHPPAGNGVATEGANGHAPSSAAPTPVAADPSADLVTVLAAVTAMCDRMVTALEADREERAALVSVLARLADTIAVEGRNTASALPTEAAPREIGRAHV